MRKYGFLKHSLVDYPGEVCSVVFLPGCNFRCAYCHNKDLVRSVAENGWTLAQIFQYLQAARSLITGVCITGGEPTLMPETLKFLIPKIKALGLKVKLDSNGSHPDLLKSLGAQVNYIAMDLKTSFERYTESIAPTSPDIECKLRASMQYLMQRPAKTYEFRTTLAWDFVDASVMHDLGKCLKPETYWYLQRWRRNNVPSTEVLLADQERIASCYAIAKKYTKNVFLRE
jgi:pyruvate formate lyase activating enzyme